jgi:hypothetical protein
MANAICLSIISFALFNAVIASIDRTFAMPLRIPLIVELGVARIAFAAMPV